MIITLRFGNQTDVEEKKATREEVTAVLATKRTQASVHAGEKKLISFSPSYKACYFS